MDMRLVVDRYDIIITQPGSNNVAVFQAAGPILSSREGYACRSAGVQNASMGNGECEGPQVGLGGLTIRLHVIEL